MHTILDLAALCMVVFYPGVLLFWLLIHLKIEYWRRMGTRSYWIACAVWPATWIVLFVFRNAIFYPRMPVSVFSTAVGIAAAAGAAYVGREVAKIIPLRTMVGIPELEPRKNSQPMLETGIYARTRNPIYFAHWLAVLAAAAITGLAANWVLFAADCVVLPLLILAEEGELAGRYGAEFEAYMRRVPRFFPRLR